MIKEKEVCPRCGSTDIIDDSTDKISANFGFPTSRVCNKCKLSMRIFPVLDEEFKKIKITPNKNLRAKYNRVDNTWGKVYIAWFKIVGWMTIITGLIILPLSTYFVIPLCFGLITLFIAYKNKLFKKKEKGD